MSEEGVYPNIYKQAIAIEWEEMRVFFAEARPLCSSCGWIVLNFVHVSEVEDSKLLAWIKTLCHTLGN